MLLKHLFSLYMSDAKYLLSFWHRLCCIKCLACERSNFVLEFLNISTEVRRFSLIDDDLLSAFCERDVLTYDAGYDEPRHVANAETLQGALNFQTSILIFHPLNWYFCTAADLCQMN